MTKTDWRDKVTGKVFISCGQHEPYEKDAATKVAKLLSDKFNLVDTYVATEVQSFDDVMKITEVLRSSDYFFFINFKRLSVFTHQEVALAHHLGFRDNIIALQEKDATLQGFLPYVLGNPKLFDGTDDLLEKVENLVKAKGWHPNFSRNLVVDLTLNSSGPVAYGDHTGQSFQQSWRATIRNRRPDAAAVGAVCLLDTIKFPSGDERPSEDRGYLKWVGHKEYERTILPETAEEVDVFAVRPDRPGIFLLSTRDTPREPIATENGKYELNYKVFARDFPLLKFTVAVDLVWEAPTPATWSIKTNAGIKKPN